MLYTLLLIALSVAPGLLIALYVIRRDAYEREPHVLLIRSFFLGAIAIIPAVFIELIVTALGFNKSANLMAVIVHALLSVALAEELSKYLVLRIYAFTKDDFNEPFDGITYSVMVAMGFATLENLLYVFDASMHSGVQIALLRMFTAVPAHAANGVLMGYFMGLAKFRNDSSSLQFTALMCAVISHGLYDFFIFIDHPGIITFGAIAVLAIACALSLKAIKLHQINSPFKYAKKIPTENSQSGFDSN